MRTALLAFAIATFVVSLMAFGGDAAMAADGGAKTKKILIAYFSRTGHTRAVAQEIRKSVGGDLVEIKAVDPYPADYDTITERAKKEQEEGARPKLSTKIKNIGSYDVVFVGYPIWWGTLPMPMFTFFESYNFSGKTIVPFCTHGGSGVARSAQDIQKLCPRSTVLEALVVNGANAKTAEREVMLWLRRLKLGK